MPTAALAFEAVAADEVRLLVGQVAEARHVEAARPPVVERAWLAHEILDEAGDVRPHQVLAEVMADEAARSCRCRWDATRLRQQHQARRFERRGGKHHRLRPCASYDLPVTVSTKPTPRAFPVAGSTVHLMRRRVRANRQAGRCPARDRSGRSANRTPRGCRSRRRGGCTRRGRSTCCGTCCHEPVGRDTRRDMASPCGPSSAARAGAALPQAFSL